MQGTALESRYLHNVLSNQKHVVQLAEGANITMWESCWLLFHQVNCLIQKHVFGLREQPTVLACFATPAVHQVLESDTCQSTVLGVCVCVCVCCPTEVRM